MANTLNKISMRTANVKTSRFLSVETVNLLNSIGNRQSSMFFDISNDNYKIEKTNKVYNFFHFWNSSSPMNMILQQHTMSYIKISFY